MNFNGLLPTEFKKDTKLELLVGSLNSIETHLPFKFYSSGFCEPENLSYFEEGIGDQLAGVQYATTPYKVRINSHFLIYCR